MTPSNALECTLVHDIVNNGDEHVAAMDPLPCPITIAWAEKDSLVPLEVSEAVVRERLPRATFAVLPESGTLRCLSTILAVTRVAKV
jgi:hypothetical protein